MARNKLSRPVVMSKSLVSKRKLWLRVNSRRLKEEGLTVQRGRVLTIDGKPSLSRYSKQTPPVEYLARCSDFLLSEFTLGRLEKASDCRKQIAALVSEMVDSLAEAELASWLQKYRRSLKRSTRS